ncbi:putative WRKY transcription factor 14 [Panicum miliaceum]|uniref:WRKY transcription factor 14 n=1 Tax=Panicum miliaceum TaxID=4540 RepID=A0A3L6RXU3_PANMI|nr:putative WRKY transcription factor 14 [Panicum miliaceum]
MCDYFLQRMDGDHRQAGDLTDVVRAGGAMQAAGVAELSSTGTPGWHQLPAPEPGAGLFPPPQPSSSDGAGPSGDGFGDTFAGLSDAFGTGSDFRACSSGGAADFFDFEAHVGGRGGGGALVDSGGGGAVARGMQMPALSPREIRPYPVMMPGLAVGPPCAFDAVGGMQMPSPHGGGIKRRKNQARKVVCIPAPAASAGGRTTGEVVPSDLWAWRKYGQKPIKGSPYPRGYYRCSSSKGCPARKQVERSRTDPSLLVITYNSEHNHPWPTQRNALAGSTRSHHAKNSKNNSSHNLQKPTVKAELDHQTPAVTSAATAATSTTTTATTSTTSNSTPTTTMAVKEEAMIGSEMEKGSTDHHDTSVALDHGDLMQQMFSQSYRPMIPEGGHHVDDFFADLAELESDPMSLIFPGCDPGSREKAASKGLGADPLFNMLDWGATNVVATSAGSSFEQGGSGL